jgi:hypothetical protein
MKDDMPEIIEKFHLFQAGQALTPSRFGYVVPMENIRNNILTPRFHDPGATSLVENLRNTHTLYWSAAKRYPLWLKKLSRIELRQEN